jgi:FKBP-type peptidyl-prolyl cis-trans isomerase (trigger factor)
MRATEVGDKRTPVSVTYQVVVEGAELESKCIDRLKAARANISLKGFRPGHVPIPHLRKIYGKQVMAEVVDAAVREANAQLIKDNRLRTTEEPKVMLPTDETAIAAVMDGNADLTYSVVMDVVPAIDLMDFTALRLERKYADVDDMVVDKAIEAMAALSRPPKAPDATEDPPPPPVDDDFARRFGAETVAQLREQIRERALVEAAAASRFRLKRALLDAIDAGHRFEVPPTLIEQEFKTVWNAVTNDLKEHKQTWEDMGTSEDDARVLYRAITERRVRIGLVITEAGDHHSIRVDDEEVKAAIAQQASRAGPAQAANVAEYYKRDPGGLVGLRAPLFEDKVVDWMLAQATVVDVLVSREELLQDDDPI